jgi:hypothetical protein
MPYSDDELMALYGGLSQAELPPETAGVDFKLPKQIANIVPKAINKLAQSATQLGQLADPDSFTPEYLAANKNPLPAFDVGPNKGIGDVLLNEAAPEVASWLVPYLGATKGIRSVAGAGRLASVLTEGIAQGGANFVSAARHEGEPGSELSPLDSGIMGGASGMLQMALPRWQRALPLAAVSALAYAKGGNAWEAGGNFIGNMLPGAWKAPIESITAPTVNTKGMDDVAAALQAAQDPGGMIARHAAPIPGAPLESPFQGGHFSFMDEVKSNFPQGTRELGDLPALQQKATDLRSQLSIAEGLGDKAKVRDLKDSINQLEQPLTPQLHEGTLDQLLGPQLEHGQQGEFQFEYPQGPRTTVNDLPQSFPREEAPTVLPTNDASLRLEGQIPKQQEFPLIALQGEGRNPHGPGFELVDSAPTKTPDKLELFDWRTDAVKAKQPLMLEAPKPITPLSSVEPSTIPLAKTTEEMKPTPAANDAAVAAENAQAELSAKRGKSFKTDGLYDVQLPNGKTVQIFRDPAERIWYQHEKHPDGSWKMLSTSTQKDALAKLAKDNAANPAPQVAATPAAAQAELPMVMNPSGDLVEMAPRMEGPHIISTVLDEGDGQYLASNNWKAPHMNGPDSIFSQHLDTATGLGTSGYLVKDGTGILRVTTDRVEALKIAKEAGQTDKVAGELHSQDLKDPVPLPVEAPKPVQVIADETVKDAQALGAVESELRANVDKAKAQNDSLGIRIANRKLQEFLAETKPEEAAAREAAVAAKFNKADISEGGKLAVNPKDSTRRFLARYSNESGAVNPEVLTHLALLSLVGAGGMFAYNRSKGDIGTTLATAVVLLGLGAAGAKSLKLLKEVRGPEVKIDLASVAKVTAKAKLEQLATETMHTPAGLAVGGRAGVWAHANNVVEGLLGLNQTEAFKSAKVKADGFIAARVEELQKAFDAVKGYKPTAAFQEAEGQFLRGQLADKQQVQQILNSGGSVTTDAFQKMTPANKAAFPEKWMVLDDPKSTNVKGSGVEIWHVSNSTKQALMKAQRDALQARATTPEDLAYMPYALKFREVADNVMNVYHDALPQGGNRARLTGTTGQYMTRSHAVITDPKVYPSEVEIGNAMDRLGLLKESEFLQKVEATQTANPMQNTPVTWRGTTYYMNPRDAMDFTYLHSPESLRGEVRDYIKEIKQRAALKKIGAIDPDSEQFTSALFTGRKELDEVTQALLSTHKSPADMMQATLNKILPAGQAASFMKDAVRAIDPRTGLKSALNTTEYNQAVEAARNAMAAGDVAAKNRYNELLSYTKSAKNDKFGLTSDLYISRGLDERMTGFDGTSFGFLDNPIGNGLRNFNSIFKTTHLALSPASIARQIAQAPMMMAMGGVRDIDAVVNGFHGYMDRSTPMGKWMNEWGVFSSSAKHGDFNHSLAEVLNGEMDKTLWGKVQKGVAKMHTMFSAADDIVRASVFMNEAKRAAKDLGVPLDALDPRVAARAQQFMLRRAMDFSNLPNYIKLGREIPFVNIFLAYSHEIARVALNTAKDAAKGDLQAGASLAGLATLPFIMQRQAEAQLSPKDRADWERAQRVVPAYSRPRFKLPLARNKDGSFNYLDITSVLPFNDYQMMARAALRGDGEALALVNPAVGLDNSPIFNVMAPQLAGRDLHTQREFRDTGDRVKNAIQQLVPGWTPGIGTEWMKSTPEALGGQLGVTNLKNARTNTSIGAWLRNTTGIDFTQIHPDIATKNYIAGAKGDIATERAYLKDVLKTDGLSVDAKKRAQDRFVEAVQHITQNLQLRLQLNTPQ